MAPSTASPPYVAAFDRYSVDKSTQSIDGLLLLQELNCISCHVADADSSIEGKTAPDLKQLAERANPFFIEKFVSDPETFHPGSTMPALLKHLNADKRAKTAKQLTHYLVSLVNDPYHETTPDLAAVSRGEKLYHQVGCVACHAPLRKTEAPPKHSRAFPKLDSKYSHSGLQGFLSNPLAVRASGRMPQMNLSDREASDIAHYLLRTKRLPAPLNYSVFHGRRESLNDEKPLELVRSGTCDNFTLDLPHQASNYTIQFDGFLRIEKAGTFTFHLKADDGAQLFIDGNLLVDGNSRTNRNQAIQRSAKMKLSKGLHEISLSYFQRAEASELKLEWQVPGLKRSRIPKHLMQNAQPAVEPLNAWKLDQAEAIAGKQAFLSIGCNECHRLQPQAKRNAAIPLNELLPESTTGCLSKPSSRGGEYPYYDLSSAQREALQHAIISLQLPDRAQPNLAEQIDLTFRQFDCYACHQREKTGGPTDNHKAFFTSNVKDMGDEGRLPPSLTGVGDKLKESWLQEVLVNRAVARPYMDTRMPHFGRSNMQGLSNWLVQQDRNPSPLPPQTDTDENAKSTGRTLVDKRRFQCIACHTFNRHKSIGMQAIDLTIMPKRLNRDWYHRYMLDPGKYRPETRMPQSWPGGNSFFTDLDGSAFRQIDAIWRYLSDGEQAKHPEGLNRQSLELIVGGEPVIYRGKLREAGYRGIAIGLPERRNFSFDAEQHRLAQIWKGRFLNVAPHWTIQGMGQIGPLGTDVITLPQGSTIARLKTDNTPWPSVTGKAAGFQFRGYSVDPFTRLPTFHYDFESIRISESFRATRSNSTPSEATLIRNINFAPFSNPAIWVRLAIGQQIDRGKHGYVVDGRLRIQIATPLDRKDQYIRESSTGQRELIVRILPTTDISSLDLHYDW